MLPCSAVRDLLPQYIENLTEEETAALIAEHLEACEDCRARLAELKAELPLSKAPGSKFDFLKKLRRRSIIGSAITILFAVFFLVALYRTEYVDIKDTLAADNSVDVIEITEIGDRLIVFYREYGEGTANGVAQYQKGLFGRYRDLGKDYSNWPLYSWEIEKIGGKSYLMIYGIERPADAVTFKMFDDGTVSGFLKGPAVSESASYSYDNPIYAGNAEAPLFIFEPVAGEAVPVLESWAPINYYIHYYDAAGDEISAIELQQEYLPHGSSGGSSSGSNVAAFYICAALTLLITFALVRYFIKP